MTNTTTTSDKATREALGVPYLRHMPLEALAAAAASFEYGAEKYAARNWEKGLPWQQMIDSLRRHLDDFERGVEIDESGLHQTCMIMASSMMLCASVIRGIGEDNRTKLLGEPHKPAMTAKEAAYWIQGQLKNTKPVLTGGLPADYDQPYDDGSVDFRELPTDSDVARLLDAFHNDGVLNRIPSLAQELIERNEQALRELPEPTQDVPVPEVDINPPFASKYRSVNRSKTQPELDDVEISVFLSPSEGLSKPATAYVYGFEAAAHGNSIAQVMERIGYKITNGDLGKKTDRKPTASVVEVMTPTTIARYDRPGTFVVHWYAFPKDASIFPKVPVDKPGEVV